MSLPLGAIVRLHNSPELKEYQRGRRASVVHVQSTLSPHPAYTVSLLGSVPPEFPQVSLTADLFDVL